jgi:hypothetical protein
MRSAHFRFEIFDKGKPPVDRDPLVILRFAILGPINMGGSGHARSNMRDLSVEHHTHCYLSPLCRENARHTQNSQQFTIMSHPKVLVAIHIQSVVQ